VKNPERFNTFVILYGILIIFYITLQVSNVKIIIIIIIKQEHTLKISVRFR